MGGATRDHVPGGTGVGFRSRYQGIALAVVGAMLGSACGAPTAGAPPTTIHDHGAGDHNHSSLELMLAETVVGDIKLEFTVEGRTALDGVSGNLYEGDPGVVVFRVTDAASGSPVEGADVDAWIDLEVGDGGSCDEQVAAFRSGGLIESAAVDLEGYFVLALNERGSISVIDPSVDVAGMTQLAGLVDLGGPVTDLAHDVESGRLFAAVPDNGVVGVIDGVALQVDELTPVQGSPRRVFVPPGGGSVWVSSVVGGEGAVTVLDPETLDVIVEYTTETPNPLVSFDAEARWAVLGGAESREVTVVDTWTAGGRALRLSDRPGSFTLTPDGTRIAFTTSAGDVVVADLASGEERARATVGEGALVGKGLDGTLVATGPRATLVSSSEGQILATLPGVAAPDQITTGSAEIYIHDSATGHVFAYTNGGGSWSTMEILTGVGGWEPATARPMAVTPDGAVVVSDPLSGTVQYAVAGSADPVGAFSGHGLGPLGVAILERRLDEILPGVYRGRFRVPPAGLYEAVIDLPDAGVSGCFSFVTAAQSQLDGVSALGVEAQPASQLIEGTPVPFRFGVTDRIHGADLSPSSLTVRATAASGAWSQDVEVVPGESGGFATEITFPEAGVYWLFFAVPEMAARFDQIPRVTVNVGPANSG